jgi:hypothetical protein
VRTSWSTAAVVGAVGLLAVARAADPVATFTEVAETGDRAAGLPAGISYSAIQPPQVDGSGTFLFESQLQGGSPGQGLTDSGVFLGHRGALQLVAHVGDPAPGAGGSVWSRLLGFGQILRSGGRVAFPGEIAGADSTHDGGLWAGTVGNLTLVAREGDPAPGTSVVYASGTRYFQDTLHLAMNDSGVVAFRAKLSGTGVTTANDQALFAGTPGALSLVARLGSVAPDAGGATFTKPSTESFSAPSINASGQILFRGHLAGAGVTPTNAEGLWFGDPAAPVLGVRAGRAVSGAGIPANSTLLGLGAVPPVLNDAGQILFEAAAFNGMDFAQAIWVGTPASFVPIVVQGQPAPGDPQAATFAGTSLALRLNSSGQAAVYGLLSSGALDWGIFGWDGTTLHELARIGAQAPGMPAGETFGLATPQDLFLNAAGKVLFRATTSPSTIVGVWLGDVATGELQLLARTGVNATAGGQTRLVIDLTLFSGSDTAGSTQDGRGAPLGDDGTYAILAQFLDGHLAVLTNAGGGGGGGTAGVTPSSLSVGTTIDVEGSGFGGGAAKFRPPKAWLTTGTSPRKIPLKVDAATASDTEFQATLPALPKGTNGAATLHVLPRVKGAQAIEASVTIELPQIASLSASTGTAGDAVTLTGSYFGTKKRKVRFVATVGDKTVIRPVPVTSWADGSIAVVLSKRLLPKGSTSIDGTLHVENDAGTSNTIPFTVQ